MACGDNNKIGCFSSTNQATDHPITSCVKVKVHANAFCGALEDRGASHLLVRPRLSSPLHSKKSVQAPPSLALFAWAGGTRADHTFIC